MTEDKEPLITTTDRRPLVEGQKIIRPPEPAKYSAPPPPPKKK